MQLAPENGAIIAKEAEHGTDLPELCEQTQGG